MKTLQIDGDKAKSLYPSSSPEFKAMLEDSFGKDYFLEKITDRVKSYEDACRILKVDIDENLVRVSSELDRDSKSIKAYAKLIIIARALNEGWVPDWNNSNQYKYYPYFDMRSGAVFYYVGFFINVTAVGSRLCFSSEKLAKYSGEQFQSIYKDYLTI